MATVTSFTAERIAEIEAGTIVSGSIDGSGHLILTKHDGTTVDAGYVLVAIGDNSIAGIKLVNNAVDNTKAADMPAGTIKGNDGVVSGDPKDLTAAQARQVIGLDQVTNVPPSSSTIGMTGEIRMWAGSSTPTGWRECDGSPVSRTSFATLYGIIGTTYGVGDGTTTFNLPNLRGRFPLGLHSTHALGSTGGEETHVLTTAEMPAHQHKISQDNSGGFAASNVQSVTAGATTHVNGTLSDRGASTSYYSGLVQSEGGGGAHNNMPPYQTIKYIIKT